MKTIGKILLIVIIIFIVYVLLIGWPEKQHKGANLACHGIWLSEKNCIGFTTVFMYID